MTEISRPWTGRTSEGAAGDAGPYSSTQWQATWKAWFGQNKDNRGVLRGVDNELAVSASSPADTNVNVATGAASVQGIFYYNNASAAVAITSNSSGSTRIDVIVLEADYTAQTVRIAVVQGTPGAGVPALTQSSAIWQIPLALLSLASGFTTITNSVITDLREYANIPSAIGFDVTNDAAVTLATGGVVIWDSAGGQDVNTTTVAGNRAVAGVIERRVTAAAVARIITHGIVSVLCDEAVAVGDLLECSTTAGQAQRSVGGGIFARVLVANTGAGTRCLAYVNVPAVPQQLVTGTYAGNGAATQAITVTGISFTPRLVRIHTTTSTQPSVFLAHKNDQDGVNASVLGNNAGGIAFVYGADQIVSLDPGGFTVGDGTPAAFNFLNASGRTYLFELWP